MADEIIIKYRADITDLKSDYDTIKKESDKLQNNPPKIKPEVDLKKTNELKGAIKDVDAELVKLKNTAGNVSNEINKGFGDAFGSLKEVFDMFKSGDLVGSFNAIKNGIAGMTSSAMSFVATPIVATIAALAGIGLATKEWLDFNVEVSKLNGEVEMLAGTTGKATDELRKNASAVSKVFGKDFTDSVNEQSQLMTQFGLDSKESFKLYVEGLARGGAKNQEFGDSIKEYGVFFNKAGFSAGDFLNVLNTGVDLGVYTDKLPDAIKEFGLRISEGTKPAQDALTNAFGSEFTNKILGGVKNGTLSVKDSLVAISKEAEKVKLNTQQLAQLTADLGGGPAEDLGGIENLFKAINQSQELATKGLTAYEQGLVNSAMKAKELEDAKDKAFKSDTAIAFMKTLDNLWTDLQIAFFETIASLRPVFEFIGKTFESIFLQIKTNVQLVSKIFSGDFKGAIDLVKGYFNSLNYIWDGVIDKMKIKISEGLLYIVKKVKPVFDALGINTDNIIKSLERSIVESSRNIDKIQQKKAGELAAAKAQAKKEEQAQKTQKSGGGGGAAPKTTKGKTREQLEKEDNDKILKQRDEALKKVSDIEVREQKKLIAKLEAKGASKTKIEEEKIKLLEAEQKYNNELLAVRSSFANQLANKYTETKQKELDAIIEGNKKIKEEEDKIANERTKFEISQALSQKDPRTGELENLKKQLQEQTGLTIEEENKRKLEILKIDQEIILSKARNNQKAIQDALQAGADYEGEAIQNALKANVELNNQLIANNKARRAEEEKQEIEAAEKRRQILKSQIDELFAFASSGLFVQLGLDPNSVSNFKNQVEAAAGFLKQANDKSKSAEEQQKARQQATLEATKAAGTAALAAVDMITSSEKAASEQRIAQLNAEQEAELAAAGDNEQKKEIIRQKYDQKIKAEKRKQFEADKRASIIKAIIGTALAVVEAAPNFVLMALAGAIGAAQIALIASQPTPKFKDGVVGFNGVVGGVGTGTSDSNLAWLSKGESVIPAQATGQNLGLVTSLVNGDVDKYIKSHYILPAIEQKEAEVIQTSQKRIDDIESKLINRTISRTLEAMRKDNKVNTAEIVTAIKKDKFTL